MQRINDNYYSWGCGAADFNRDGNLDIVAGPYIYFGPDFTRFREIYPANPFNPSREFTDVNCQYTFDFNGDGWPDILTGPPKAILYINPKGESRRWDKFEVISSIQTEITVFRDIDGGGIPALVYGADGELRYAKPDPERSHQPWVAHTISERGCPGARHRRRRHQRRRPHGRRQPRTAGGNSRPKGPSRSPGRIIRRRSAATVARAPRRRRDGRLRRQWRRTERRRDRLNAHGFGPRLVRAEARCGRQHLVRAAHDHGRLLQPRTPAA